MRHEIFDERGALSYKVNDGQPESKPPVRLQRVVLPQPDEPCPLCEAKGRRIILTFEYDPQYIEVECCDCLGTGRRPVRQNDQAQRPGR
jgi:hypothetical protein